MISNHNKNEKLKVSSHFIKMYSVIYISAEGTIRLLNTKIKEKLGDNKIECLLAKCAYCGVDHTNSNSSIGPWKWDENNNCTFVSYHVEIDHAANCSCPLNPHSYIFNLQCSCGESCNEEIKGPFCFIKKEDSKTEMEENGNPKRIISNCTEDDLKGFIQYIENLKLKRTSRIAIWKTWFLDHFE